jgi:hypothetical protein
MLNSTPKLLRELYRTGEKEDGLALPADLTTSRSVGALDLRSGGRSAS